MSRASFITQILTEALSPGTKSALKWSAAGLGTAAAGYLAYKHGGDIKHLFSREVMTPVDPTGSVTSQPAGTPSKGVTIYQPKQKTYSLENLYRNRTTY